MSGEEVMCEEFFFNQKHSSFTKIIINLLKIPVLIFTEIKSESHYTNCGHPQPSLSISKLRVFSNQKKGEKKLRLSGLSFRFTSVTPSVTGLSLFSP